METAALEAGDPGADEPRPSDRYERLRSAALAAGGAVIAKDFPLVKDFHQIRCLSFVITRDHGQRAGARAGITAG
jgi:hypothetical protein